MVKGVWDEGKEKGRDGFYSYICSITNVSVFVYIFFLKANNISVYGSCCCCCFLLGEGGRLPLASAFWVVITYTAVPSLLSPNKTARPLGDCIGFPASYLSPRVPSRVAAFPLPSHSPKIKRFRPSAVAEEGTSL